jgi:hypothetical protein
LLAAALLLFAVACVALTLHRHDRLEALPLLRTALQMLFAAYFLVALAYLLHCTAWAITRAGQKVHLDELFSRMIALAFFALVDLGAYLCLRICLNTG